MCSEWVRFYCLLSRNGSLSNVLACQVSDIRHRNDFTAASLFFARDRFAPLPPVGAGRVSLSCRGRTDALPMRPQTPDMKTAFTQVLQS